MYGGMSKKIAVLTGAGISTSAGIPDFRGPDLANKEDREYSWRWQKESPVWNAQPGTAHKALVKLEQAGLLTLLATQNFDALHEKAGNSSNVIVNLHGTIGTSHCMKCHAKYDTAEIMAAQADELWVIGSTLEVMPAASIVPVAAQAGVPITIMNMGRTQYDRLATRLIRDDIAIALPQLVDETIAAEQGK